MTLAPIALTIGEPAGIGPEIAVKARQSLGGEVPFFAIGDAKFFEPSQIVVISDPTQAAKVSGDKLPLLQLPFLGSAQLGDPDPANAQSVIDAIEMAVNLVREGRASAVCTAPIHKKALIDGAGFAYPGHTEFLAALANTPRVVMMLCSEQLSVVPTTIHIPLADVPSALTPDLLAETIEITHSAMKRDFGLKTPRIAVAGLNPHAGEGGVMGTEDRDVIAPVIKKFAENGMAITGPLSADTMFHAKARACYDVAICAYHDQALIPIKTLDFDRGVNVTLGLPFIRTSPDHGTAFDIAGKGIANPSSLIEALRLAHKMARART